MRIEKMAKKLKILGIRGVPAAHGGFETFAHEFSIYLKENNWDVEVYCQQLSGDRFYQDAWNGVKRINIRVGSDSSLSSVWFDFLTILHCLREKTPCLMLGYNTAIFGVLLRIFRVPLIINMDGIEWKRGKWGRIAKFWFWFNDWIGCLSANRLIADNPGIEAHLATRGVREKITMIPYGAANIESPSFENIRKFGVDSFEYCTLIARPEPENSILEIVQEFSREKRNCKLLVLGDYSNPNAYKKRVLDVASSEVVFPGAIYDKDVVSSLRYYSRIYFHGHTVGGTNPSLIEAMAAGNAVIAHGNIYNKWVLGDSGLFFIDASDLHELISTCLHDDQQLKDLRAKVKQRFLGNFTLDKIHASYESEISKFLQDA